MLEIIIPSLQDLAFRKEFMSDEATMAYNHAWGGTIDFPEEKWATWYKKWVLQPDGKRYYRYLKEDDTFVGEISYHFDGEIAIADVIIPAAYRGRGYGREGLRLLCAAAKENGITVLYDDIAIDNTAAFRLFTSEGFAEEHRTDNVIMLKKTL